MHHKLIPQATETQLREFLTEEFDELKSWDKSLYDRMEDKLYVKLFGNHFSKASYECAVSFLENKDGTKGAHWSKEDITNYARTKGLSYSDFNEYDFAYAMNMVYSDYFGVIPDSTESYYKVAKAFIEDKDAPVGKAYLYYKAMKAEKD